MKSRIARRLDAALSRFLPEQRLFLRSDTETRFIRLSPFHQAIALSGSAALVGWAIVATAILLMDSIGSGNAREQMVRDQETYELRLEELAAERDGRAMEALAAQERFAAALRTVSTMQSQLLASEEKRREMETAMAILQDKFRQVHAELDGVEAELAVMQGGQTDGLDAVDTLPPHMIETLEVMANALDNTAAERDDASAAAAAAAAAVEEIAFEKELLLDRNDRIFTQLEQAVSVSIEPLNKMFRDAGLPPEQLLNTVRQGYNGAGGPMTPIAFSTKGLPIDPETMRANQILEGLDRMNRFRAVAERAPFAMPVNSAVRYTSGFGMRWGRMHNGSDFAGPTGTPIYTTADGVVTYAGWQSGYGRLVKIQHEFGIETRYAHMSRIRVVEGQRVSRGDRIGDMGNTGRSTGTHLHYEVRVGGRPVNPMKFIKAGRDVF